MEVCGRCDGTRGSIGPMPDSTHAHCVSVGSGDTTPEPRSGHAQRPGEEAKEGERH